MESTPEQVAEGLTIVKVLAAVLERLVCANVNLALADPGQVTKFHALKAPGIGILPYLERIHKYASCSNECFILALIYIDRLIQRNNFLLTELNVHRVVITAILLAAKFFDDAYYNNAYYSKVGGVLVSEMNGLEVDFLFRINFSLHVPPEIFEKYKAELVAHSINSGITIPQAPSPQPQINDINGMSLDNVVIALQTVAFPVTMQTQPNHHLSHQVTPSPSNAASRAASVPLVAPPVEPQRVESNTINHPVYVADQLFPTGMTQQLMQRANSMPLYPSHTGRCVDNNPPYSAPMMSMLPVGVVEDQYLVMSNQIFPLQTTLEHHHHGVESYHEQNGFHHHQQHVGAGYALPHDGIGSLVAGHY